MLQFEVNSFIKKHITRRPESMFLPDIDTNKAVLSNAIQGKKLLVIGGAGTIGSSFIKAIIRFKPSSLIVVDYNENGLTELTRDLRSSLSEFVPTEYITYPFDFGGPIFEKLLNDHQFDVIACFAAHKHVRSEKDHLAIEAMVRNNVFNTKNLIELAMANKPNHFFCVSTDKAANPVNVMGASKKVMEKVLLAYTKELKITTARFANVAFSNGSLLFGFLERIMKRQPLTAPLDIKRYFVSPEESGQLCMLACIMGNSSDIFFPKLNASQMMSFSDIAENFLLEMGLEAQHCQTPEEARQLAKKWKPGMKKYPVFFFASDTSGEKPYEEFFTDTDNVDMKAFEALGVVKNSEILPKENINGMINQFDSLFASNKIEKKDVVNLLNNILPDFSHIETGKGLDEKM